MRHALGEYYTPEWLVREMLDEAGYTGRPGTRLLDPACGSGVFLTEAIRRIRSGAEAEDPLRTIAEGIAGYDLNPLAVLTARANFLIAVGDLLPRSGPIRIPIYLRDSILESGEAPAFSGRFDYVVGNPPWIAWDDLPAEYREATKPLCASTGCSHFQAPMPGMAAARKTSRCAMTYVAADRYLKDGGRLAVVITQDFRSRRKGPATVFAAFAWVRTGRRWACSVSTIWLPPAPFRPPPIGRPRCSWKRADRPSTRCPISNGPLRPRDLGNPASDRSQNGVGAERAFQRQCYHARPADPEHPASPWFLWPQQWDGGAAGNGRSGLILGPSDYQAHLGANTGGANGVYWVELVDPPCSHRVRPQRPCGFATAPAGQSEACRWSRIGWNPTFSIRCFAGPT